jgi:hypothetical protein
MIQLINANQLKLLDKERDVTFHLNTRGLISQYSMFPQALHSPMHLWKNDEKRGAGACGQLWLGLAERKSMGKNRSFCCSLVVCRFCRLFHPKRNTLAMSSRFTESVVLLWFL